MLLAQNSDTGLSPTSKVTSKPRLAASSILAFIISRVSGKSGNTKITPRQWRLPASVVRTPSPVTILGSVPRSALQPYQIYFRVMGYQIGNRMQVQGQSCHIQSLGF